MFDFHEKRKIKSWLYSKLSIALLLVAVVFLSRSVIERYTTHQAISEKREVKEAELEELTLRAAALEAKVEHLEDDRGIEEELRNRFDVAREGEQVVIILENDADAEAAVLEEAIMQPDEKTFWDRVLFWR